VLLKPIEKGTLNVRVWNPKGNPGDRYHLMPVITPAYPSMCATYNITHSSMAVINRELSRGLEISEAIMMNKRPWSDLFAKHTFFTSDYKYYLSVISAAKTKEAHKIWAGFVESKVRLLVQKIEQHPSIALARPFNKGYERRHRCKNDDEIAMVQDGYLDFHVTGDEPSAGEAADGEANGVKTEDGAETVSEIYTTTHYIGLVLASADAKSLDLSYQVNEFKTLCFGWKKFQDELQPYASLGVRHVRNFNLPDDVFEKGEKKPVKKSAAQNSKDKKRGATEVLQQHRLPTPNHNMRRCRQSLLAREKQTDTDGRTMLPQRKDSKLRSRPLAEGETFLTSILAAVSYTSLQPHKTRKTSRIFLEPTAIGLETS
jgi:poly(A) polymerase